MIPGNDITDEVVDYQYKNNNNYMKTKWWQSSHDPRELSITIKGFLMAWIPMIIAVGQLFNVPLTTEALTELVQSITTFISAGMIIGGIIRKAYYWVEK